MTTKQKQSLLSLGYRTKGHHVRNLKLKVISCGFLFTENTQVGNRKKNECFPQ